MSRISRNRETGWAIYTQAVGAATFRTELITLGGVLKELKAAFGRELGKPLGIEEIRIAPPQAGEVVEEVGPGVDGRKAGDYVIARGEVLRNVIA